MTQQEKSRKSFREFRVDSICSTSNPDAFINETAGLDDFVAGKATGAATSGAKKAGAAIDPTKAGKKKRLEKQDKKEAHKDKIKKMEQEIQTLGKEISSGTTDPLEGDEAKEKIKGVKDQIALLKTQITAKPPVKIAVNDAGRPEVVKDDDGNPVKLDAKAIAKLEDEVKEREKDIQSVKEPRELSDDQVKAKREQLKDKKKQLTQAKLTNPAKESIGESFNLNEQPIIDTMKSIVDKGQFQKVKLGDGKQINVDLMTAGAVVKVYDALNARNKDKFASALYKNRAGFTKMSSFAIKNVSY
jgi:DNA repair exonuclease SbcCD ATPase subunit